MLSYHYLSANHCKEILMSNREPKKLSKKTASPKPTLADKKTAPAKMNVTAAVRPTFEKFAKKSGRSN
jgi:hypothetical protein